MNQLFQSINSVDAIVCSYDTVIGEMENSYLQVTAYRPDIFRIHVAREKNFQKFSYAVIQSPQPFEGTIEEADHEVRIETTKAQLVIDKRNFLVSLKDQEGHILNEDEEGLGTGFQGDHISVFKKLQPGERFLGLGEKTGNLDRRGEGYTNWNTDEFAARPGSDPLYSSNPFYIGIHSGRCYGVFLDNSCKTHFNFGASNNRFASFSAEAGDMDYYLFAGGSVAEIVGGYTWLTGRMELPPKWSLGYQQCRYSYYPEHEVRTVAQTFRNKQIPCDVIYNDIHYMEDYKLFTWDKERFPNPKKLIDDLHNDGFKVTVIVDPGVKIEDGYEAYDDGKEKDVFLKYPDGQYYSGDVWPGTCHFPDFTSAKAREWWGSKFEELVKQGVDGFWNDMNEIATWGHFLPNIVEFDFEGAKTSMKEARNVYGTQMARATKEGVEKMIGDKRTMIITRAAYSGLQRYGLLWTGDNSSTDESMMLGCRMVTSIGLTGIAFTGNDVGGFAGRTEVDLFARWLSIAVFQPFLRGHTFVNTADAEPWAFGEEVEEIARNYINLRYRLLPYIYTIFKESSEIGMPIARTLAIDYTHDELVYDTRFQNQFLLGPSLLVAPVESFKEITKVYLPAGEWYDFHDGSMHVGEQIIYADCPIRKLPIYVKAGTVLPMQTLVQYTGEDHDGVLHLHVFVGGNGSVFELYEDDGETKAFQRGEFTSKEIIYDGRGRLELTQAKGEYSSDFKWLKVYIHGLDQVPAMVVDGEPATTKELDFSFFEPISQFDPCGEVGFVERSKVFATDCSLPGKGVVVSW